MEGLSREFRVTLLWKLYADDLVVIAETEDNLIKRLCEWKDNMETRSMRVNLNKAKLMISEEWQKAARWPCGVELTWVVLDKGPCDGCCCNYAKFSAAAAA